MVSYPFNTLVQLHRAFALLEVQLLHALDLVAHLFEGTDRAVRSQPVHDVIERERYLVHLLGRIRKLLAQLPVTGHEDHADVVYELVFLVLLDEAVAYRAETDAALYRLLRYAHLFPLILRRYAHHIAFRINMVFHKLHVPYRPERLLIVAADVVHMQQHQSRKGSIRTDGAQIGADQYYLVLRHKAGVRRDAGAVRGRIAAAAQLEGRVPRQHQLVLAQILPRAPGLVCPALRLLPAELLRQLPDRAVV